MRLGNGMTAVAGWRLLGLGLAFVANMAVFAILARDGEIAAYALFALVASFLFLMPFADLGLGANVINATSDAHAGRLAPADYTHELRRIVRTLVGIGALIATASVGAFALGLWPAVLGSASGGRTSEVVAMVTGVAVAAGVPLGVGGRVLQGLRRNLDATRLGVLGPVAQLVVVGAVHVTGLGPEAFALAPAVGLLTSAGAVVLRARRLLSDDGLLVAPSATRPTEYVAESRGTAASFLVVSIGTTLSLQSHRLVLAQLSTAGQLAAYALVAQFANPMLSVVQVVSQNLWSEYRTARAEKRMTLRRLYRDMARFAGMGAGAACVVAVVVPVVAHVAGDGAVRVSPLLLALGGLYVVCLAMHQPVGMLMTDARGMRLQAGLITLASAVIIGVMLVAVPRFGALATYSTAALAIVALQTTPLVLVARRSLAAT